MMNEENKGYRCFHCQENTVAYDNDFSFEDCGYCGDGIVHFLHCTNCGAIIIYKVPLDNEDDEQ